MQTVIRHPSGFFAAPRFTALLLTLVLSAVARAEIEFVGVLITTESSSFALTDDAARPATWRALGQNFAGYSLAAFDLKTDTLTLTKNGEALKLRLKDDAKIKDDRVELFGTITAGQGEKLEVKRVTLFFDTWTVVPLKDGTTWNLRPSRMSDGNIRYGFSVDREIQKGDVRDFSRVSSSSVIARPRDAFKIVVNDLECAFTPTNSKDADLAKAEQDVRWRKLRELRDANLAAEKTPSLK